MIVYIFNRKNTSIIIIIITYDMVQYTQISWYYIKYIWLRREKKKMKICFIYKLPSRRFCAMLNFSWYLTRLQSFFFILFNNAILNTFMNSAVDIPKSTRTFLQREWWDERDIAWPTTCIGLLLQTKSSSNSSVSSTNSYIPILPVILTQSRKTWNRTLLL